MEHGRISTYNSGCRCEACREARAGREFTDYYKRKARYEGKEWPEDWKYHGTIHGYQTYWCRCDRCRAAYSIKNKNRKGGTWTK